MHILSTGLFIFFLAFAIHLIIMRIHIPQYQSKALLMTFFGTFLLWVIFSYLLSQSYAWPFFHYHGLPEFFHICLLFISLTLAYFFTYPALEVDSPSLIIIRMIAETMPGGLAKKDLEKRLTDDILILPRINDLLRDNLVIVNGERLQLTPQGRLFIKIFIIFRTFLKFGKGG